MSKQKTMTSVAVGLRLRGLTVSCVVAGVCLLTAGPAVASSPTPAWTIISTSMPTSFAPGSSDFYAIAIMNVGRGPTDGTPVTVTDTLPEGVTPATGTGTNNGCTISGQTITCPVYSNEQTLTSEFEPGEMNVGLDIDVNVSPSAREGTAVTNTVSVSGGGAPTISTTEQTAIRSATPPFGLAGFGVGAFTPDGTPDTQAGSHPYALTTTFFLNSGPRQESHAGSFGGREVIGNIKEVQVGSPLGLIGNPQAIPQCTQDEFVEEACPPNSQVGVARTDFSESPGTQFHPLYNMVPPLGVPAQFAYNLQYGGIQARVRLDVRIRTGSDYGVTVSTSAIPQLVGVVGNSVTFWGVPADPSHDAQRCGASIVREQEGNQYPREFVPLCNEASGTVFGPHPFTAPAKPFLTMPTACPGTPLHWSMETNSWQEPDTLASRDTSTPATTDCESLDFSPTLTARPTTNAADSSSGLSVDLHVPQREACTEEAGGAVVCENAEAELKDATVTLPAGLVVDPSSADGLAGCSLLSGKDPVQEERESKGEVSGINLETAFAPNCPEASKLGTVEVDTPLVDHALPGAMYLAQQGANPFKSLLALYLVINDPVSGVVIKLAGKVTADPKTGQLSVTFDNNPQLPFEDLKVNLFSGSRAPLTTPLTCGSYSLGTALTPWSAPAGKDATPSSEPFTISAGCSSSETQAPNAPGFEAGTASPVAGTFSPFVLKLKREDGSQHFSALDVTLPPGLTGKIAGVEECSQADIEAAEARSHEGQGALEQAHPSCPAASQVGVVHVGTGSGAPFFVTGQAYFAGPYKGAPFSLVFVTPAVAGPFDLGTVVVRAGIYIDPYTAQVSVKSDPFPTILDGVPLDIRSVDVETNRKEFMLNPTSCSEMSVTGQEASIAGQTAALSDRFQAGGCTTLPFKATLNAETHAHHSRTTGSYLRVTIAAEPGEANLAKVRVTLPKKLPAQLSTLKEACSQAQFAANPAGCPRASYVGTVVVHTPVLAKPLTGPAIYVGHGGLKLPDLALVLQGEGITIIQEGITQISKGFTSSSFDAIPDVPVSSIELTLPEGAKPALGGNSGNLCSQTVTKRVAKRVRGKLVHRTRHFEKRLKLIMSTTITGQNGALIQQETAIKVTGCHTAVTKHHKKRHHKHRKKRK